MDSNSCEKRSRNECVDRISDLPDSILGKILSRLPVKNVIATSVLSTRWKTLFPYWVTLTELDLDDTDSSSRNFINFVDKLLNVTLRDAACVEKVVLNCQHRYNCQNRYGDAKIVSWVCAALRLNIVHLRLMSHLFNSVPLFNSLHGCTTLVELELGKNFLLDLPGGLSIPNLRKLLLYRLSFGDDVGSVRKLIAGCPVLNDLSIVGCDVSGLDNLYIQHPFITNLIIETCNFGRRPTGCCRVVIDAPNLETFAHTGDFVSKYVWENVKSLHSVSVDFNFFEDKRKTAQYYYQRRRLAKFVIACSSTKHLCLYRHLLMALYESLIELPTFQNLTCLTVGGMGSSGWKMIARFLERAPNLEVLTFAEGLGGSMGTYEGFESKLPSVPICLELHLEKIEIWGFRGTPDEVKLMRYFLKNGRVLQELIVHYLPCENISNTTKLSVLPRHSEACKVLVMEGECPGNCFSHSSWF